ncbi:hypothetical protein ACWD0A_05235 [Streptomyces sp. NPDC002867]
MTRSLKEVDDALAKLDGELRPLDLPKKVPENTKAISDIRAQLGSLPAPGQGKTVAERLTALEAKVVALSDTIKLDRMIFLGYAISTAFIKIDVQAIKIDLTLLKKVDEKNVALFKGLIKRVQNGIDKRITSTGDGSLYRKVKDSIWRQAAAERKEREAKEEREKERKEKREERLQKHIRDLPRKVAINTRDIEKIYGALRGARDAAKNARDDRTGLPKNHAGVDAGSPRIGPVAKDVRNLRSSVDELIRSLGFL